MCVEGDGDGGGSSSRGHQAWTERTGTKRSDEEVKKVKILDFYVFILY